MHIKFWVERSLLSGFLLLLAALTAQTWWTNLRSPLDANPNEGWNAYRIDRALQPVELYPRDTSWRITTYPPFSFWIGKLATLLTGNANLAGRLCSLVSLWALGLILFAVLRRENWQREHAAFMGAIYIAFLTVYFLDYVAVNDPHLLALAIGAVSIPLITGQRPTADRLYWAAACCTIACFTKNSMISFPAFVLLYLGCQGWWREARRFGLACFFVGVTFLGVLYFLYGDSFFAHLLAKRGYSFSQVKTIFQIHLHDAAHLLILAGLFALKRGSSAWQDWRLIGSAVTFAAAIAFTGGGGVGHNMYIESTFFLFCASLEFLRQAVFSSASGPPRFINLAVAALLLFVPRLPGMVNGMRGIGRTPETFAEDRIQREYLRQQPGPAVCESILLCNAAGKTEEISLYWTGESLRTGRLSVETVSRLLRDRHFAVIQVNWLDSFDPQTSPWVMYPGYPEELSSELKRNYRVARRGNHKTFLVPKEKSAEPEIRAN